MKTFDQYMAERGKQSELDELRRTFRYDQAKAQYESQGYYGGVDEYLEATNPAVAMFEKSQKAASDYLEKNPFYYDEQWLKDTKAQVQSEVDLEPYYKEKVSTYLDDVSTQKSRANEDETTLLKELDRQQKVFQKEDAVSYQQARSAALEGLSDANLIGSGEGMRQTNIGDISHTTGVENYLDTNAAKKQQAQTTTSRLLSDLDKNSSRFQTEVEREKELQVQSEILNRKKEKQDYWTAGFQKATGQIAPGYQAYLG